MHGSLWSDLVKRCLLFNRWIGSALWWFCCWYIVGWCTLVSNALHSYSKCCQQGVSHLFPTVIKCLHCNANITSKFTTVKGRDLDLKDQCRTDTYLYVDCDLLGCNLVDGCQYYTEDGSSSFPHDTGTYPTNYVVSHPRSLTAVWTSNLTNLLQNQNVITINTAIKLNLHD